MAEHKTKKARKEGFDAKFERKLHPVETLTRVIIFLAIVGSLVASYLIYLHYSPSDSSFCNINEQLNCDVVNKSPYSEFLGVPVAIIGLAGYLAFIVIGTCFLTGYDWSKIHNKLRPKHLNWLLMVFAIIGIAFSLYLAYIEEFVLHTWCIMCIASLLIITSLLVLTIINYKYCTKCRNMLVKAGMKSVKSCRYC